MWILIILNTEVFWDYWKVYLYLRNKKESWEQVKLKIIFIIARIFKSICENKLFHLFRISLEDNGPNRFHQNWTVS